MMNAKAAIVITALITLGIGLLGGFFWGKNSASKANGTTPATPSTPVK